MSILYIAEWQEELQLTPLLSFSYLSWTGEQPEKMLDKGELYIYFTPLYLVFCLVYHQFWAFYVCFYLVGDVRAKESQNE